MHNKPQYVRTDDDDSMSVLAWISVHLIYRPSPPLTTGPAELAAATSPNASRTGDKVPLRVWERNGGGADGMERRRRRRRRGRIRGAMEDFCVPSSFLSSSPPSPRPLKLDTSRHQLFFFSPSSLFVQVSLSGFSKVRSNPWTTE